MHLSSILKDKLQIHLTDKEGEGSSIAGNSLCKDSELQRSAVCSEKQMCSGELRGKPHACVMDGVSYQNRHA